MKIGFYGGKFVPFHLGHYYCIRKACELCDIVHVILFDSPPNKHLETGTNIDEYLTIESRMDILNEVAKINSKVKVHYIDTSSCVLPSGEEDWDAETPLVLNAVGGKFDYVFSSEPSYDEYFKRAYPFAKHIIVDADRIIYPISGTKCRSMTLEEAKHWMVKFQLNNVGV